MAASQLLRAANTAPAMAVPVKVLDGLVVVVVVSIVRPFGRFWKERREVGLVVCFVVFETFGVLKHFALVIAIAAMVEAIDGAVNH